MVCVHTGTNPRFYFIINVNDIGQFYFVSMILRFSLVTSKVSACTHVHAEIHLKVNILSLSRCIHMRILSKSHAKHKIIQTYFGSKKLKFKHCFFIIISFYELDQKAHVCIDFELFGTKINFSFIFIFQELFEVPKCVLEGVQVIMCVCISQYRTHFAFISLLPWSWLSPHNQDSLH